MSPPKLGKALVQIEAIGNRVQGFEFLVTTVPTLDRPTVIAMFKLVTEQLERAERAEIQP